MIYVLIDRAVESESRPDLKLVGVNHFGQSWSQSWSWENFADSNTNPESQDTTQQMVILAKNTERLEEKESGSVEIKLSII